MIIWHRNRRGRGGTTPRCRSRNIANNTFSEGWLQKSDEFAGLRTAPATHHAKNTANTTFSCGMLQNAGFGTIPCGGGGGSEPRTGIIYKSWHLLIFLGDITNPSGSFGCRKKYENAAREPPSKEIHIRWNYSYTPPKQTWNLKMDPWKRRFQFSKPIISRFHVEIWGVYLQHSLLRIIVGLEPYGGV